MSKLIRMTTGLVLAAGVLLTVPACNTVDGVGQDTKETGRNIERAADKTHDAMKD